MLQGANLLRRRKKIIIKRKKWGVFYVLIASFCLSFLIFFTGYFLNEYFPDFLSPLAKTKFQDRARLESSLKKANIKFIKITTQGDLSLLVELSSQEGVIFSSKKDIQSQIASLQLVVKRLTIEGKRFKSLDFRFDKPMITF
jgi:hypothetical protein